MNNSGFFSLHPENPRYFLFRGEPLVLVTCTEHYGAVINRDFDYISYLDMLKNMGFRLTRIFTFYREQPGSCSGLEAKENLYFPELGNQNTLAPSAASYLAPWQRSSEPGCFDGGNKFDLTKWDEAYFERLKDFCLKASERGIIVEVCFFSNMYSGSDTGPWKVCPINSINNINGIGDIEYYEFTGLIDKDVVSVQEELVKKVVSELKDFDNIYYELCNEPNPLPDQPRLENWQIAE